MEHHLAILELKQSLTGDGKGYQESDVWNVTASMLMERSKIIIKS
jgi:hypothetical protein